MENERRRLCLAGSAAIIAIAIRRHRHRRNRRKRLLWTRPWILKREQFGAYHCLLQELRASDRIGLKNYLRMNQSSFNEILNRVAPIIQKEDTQLRTSTL